MSTASRALRCTGRPATGASGGRSSGAGWPTMPEIGLPYAMVTQFTVNPAAGEAFDALVAQTAAAARQNVPGVLVYACHLVDGEPSARIIYEMYTGRAAFDAWQASEPARNFAAGIRS